MTVRYEAVNAMLLNEFLKEHRKAEEPGRKQKEEEAAIQELNNLSLRDSRKKSTPLRQVCAQLAMSWREAKLLPSWSLIIIELNLYENIVIYPCQATIMPFWA